MDAPVDARRFGTIPVVNGNPDFAVGKTTLNDNVSVQGNAGTVTNSDDLKLDATHSIVGSFTQSGGACSARSTDVWTCYGRFTLSEVTRANFLTVDVSTRAAAPEPSRPARCW